MPSGGRNSHEGVEPNARGPLGDRLRAHPLEPAGCDPSGKAREERFPASEAVVQALCLALGLQLPPRGLRPDDELERDFVVDRQAGERPEDVPQGLSLEGRADREVIAPRESEFGDADITAPPGAIACWQELERPIRRAQLRFDEDAFA